MILTPVERRFCVGAQAFLALALAWVLLTKAVMLSLWIALLLVWGWLILRADRKETGRSRDECR